MTDYKTIRGKKIKFLTSDLSSEQGEGQIFYSDTSDEFKVGITNAAWRSSTSFSTSGYGAAGSGTLTAGLIMGRNTLASGDTPSNATEEWNGSGWATGGNLSTARYYGGAIGTQTATVFVGGDSRPPGSGSQTTAENYNGTSWTSGTAYPVAVTLASGFGTTSAGLMCNGSDTTYSATTKEYNGSWTAGGDLNTARRWIGTAGTQTAGLAFGGQIAPAGYSTNVTEEYDGSSWTSSGSLNTTRAVNAVGGGINQDASQTNALASGGYQSSGSPKSYFNETEIYNGSTWTSSSNMTTARGYGTGGGTGSAGIVAGSYTGSITTAVEEFNQSALVVTAGAWASGGNLPVANKFMGGGGTQTAGIASGGQIVPGSIVGETYEYDGSAWTDASADMGNSKLGRASCGTQTANLVAGGQPDTAAVEEYNGTSWAEQTDIPGARDAAAMAGIQTAAIFTGGDYPNANNNAETFEYDGSSWTDTTDIPTAVRAHTMFGTQSAAVVCGGYTTTRVATTYEWDDSSWTAGGNMATARYSAIGCGTQTDGLIAGGDESPYSSATEGYDGSVWSSRPSMATARQMSGAASQGPSTATMGAGGATASAGEGVVNTEEFTGSIGSLNLKTITDS